MRLTMRIRRLFSKTVLPTKHHDTEIIKKIDKIRKKRTKVKKFGERNRKSFTKTDLKVIHQSFDDLTKDIIDGNLDIKAYEEQRITRKLEQNFNTYAYGSRLRNRLENLRLSLGDNLTFPWNFHQDYSPEPERSLACPLPFETFLTPDTLDSLLRRFVQGLVDKDYTRMRQISEPGFVKRIRQNFRMMTDLEVECPNADSAFFEYDLYNIRNLFTVDLQQNRRQNFFFDKCQIYEDEAMGAPFTFYIPKRLNRMPVARIFFQFELNLKTDLDLKLVNDGELYREDSGLAEVGFATHNLKVEVLVAEAKYRALLNVGAGNADIDSLRCFLGEPDVRIIDIDGFMKGNPLLKGL